MKLLANGAHRSEINVFPKNWKTTKTIKSEWRVFYRFYNPPHTGPGTMYPKGKLVVIRGMNDFATADEHRKYARCVIDEVTNKLDVCDFNPITGYHQELTSPTPSSTTQ